MRVSVLGCLGFIGLAQATPTTATSTLLKVPFITTLSLGNSTLDGSTTTVGIEVVVSVQAGNGQTWNNVLIDTGSAILWVGRGSQKYIPGPSSHLNATFSVGYGTGGASGLAYQDAVTIGDAVVSSQIIGAANDTNGFTNNGAIDGILGMGPPGSNQGEVSGFNTTPTFVENLVSEGKIGKAVFGLYVAPLDEDGEPQGSGELSFGGIDQARIQGEMTWIPQNAPYTPRWALNVSTISFGEGIASNESIFAYTDSGNILIQIPTQQFIAILQTVPGANLDQSQSTLDSAIIFENTTANALPDLVFGFENLTVTIPPNRYIVQKNLYSSLNITDDGAIHTWIVSGGWSTAILGEKFLENVYSAYDLDNHLIGFANLA
ncbi:acid protease [Amylocystis lapponica]|nr:acid protease [Amylocystis lapponica]